MGLEAGVDQFYREVLQAVYIRPDKLISISNKDRSGLLQQAVYSGVYHATDTAGNLGQVTAKIIPKAFFDLAGMDPHREYTSRSQITDPAIPRPLHWRFARMNNNDYFIFLDPPTREHYDTSQLTFTKDGARRVMIAVANGLAAAHEKNLVHTDVKRSNVLVEVKGASQNHAALQQPIDKPTGVLIIDWEGAPNIGSPVRIATPQYCPKELHTLIATPALDILALSHMYEELCERTVPPSLDTKVNIDLYKLRPVCIDALLRAQENYVRKLHGTR